MIRLIYTTERATRRRKPHQAEIECSIRCPDRFGFLSLPGLSFSYRHRQFPVFGFFFLAAPFWSVVTLNVGFLSIGIEAVAGKVHRAWLVAPMLWFAGYEYVAWQS